MIQGYSEIPTGLAHFLCQLWAILGIILILFVVAESFLHGAFVQTVGRTTLILAMITALILFFHFWKWIIVGALVAMGISLMYQRLRELTGGTSS